MKVKVLFTNIVLLCLPFFFYAQIVEVQYQQTYNTSSIKLDKTFNLLLNDNTSIYLEQESIAINKNSDDKYNQRTIALETGNKIKNNLYLNEKNAFYFVETFFGNPLKIKEDDFKNNWQILDSTKYVSKFKCNLAKKSFRGRTYYAWYTSEIPTTFGPWKLNGLNGLILEAYDEKKQFEIRALKVNFIKSEKEKYDVIFSDNIAQFSKNKEIISIEQLKNLIADKNEIILNRIKQQLPRGASVPKLNDDCEECDETLEKY